MRPVSRAHPNGIEYFYSPFHQDCPCPTGPLRLVHDDPDRNVQFAVTSKLAPIFIRAFGAAEWEGCSRVKRNPKSAEEEGRWRFSASDLALSLTYRTSVLHDFSPFCFVPLIRIKLGSCYRILGWHREPDVRHSGAFI